MKREQPENMHCVPVHRSRVTPHRCHVPNHCLSTLSVLHQADHLHSLYLMLPVSTLGWVSRSLIEKVLKSPSDVQKQVYSVILASRGPPPCLPSWEPWWSAWDREGFFHLRIPPSVHHRSHGWCSARLAVSQTPADPTTSDSPVRCAIKWYISLKLCITILTNQRHSDIWQYISCI